MEMLDGGEMSTSVLGMDAHGRAGRFNECNLVSQWRSCIMLWKEKRLFGFLENVSCEFTTI